VLNYTHSLRKEHKIKIKRVHKMNDLDEVKHNELLIQLNKLDDHAS